MASTVEPMAPTEHERGGSQLAELTRLHTDLDRLWEQYLGLIDRYQEAQKDLQKHLSSGFFDLAQANFKVPNGQRYGQDYYDGRMKASRRYCSNGDGVVVGLPSDPDGMPSRSQGFAGNVDRPGKDREDVEPKQQPSPPSTPSPDDHDSHREDTAAAPTDGDEQNKSHEESLPKPQQDPLHWFGILVPRELRSVKMSFSSALEAPIVEAANLGRELRQIEAEIRGARKAVKKAEKTAGGG